MKRDNQIVPASDMEHKFEYEQGELAKPNRGPDAQRLEHITYVPSIVQHAHIGVWDEEHDVPLETILIHPTLGSGSKEET